MTQKSMMTMTVLVLWLDVKEPVFFLTFGRNIGSSGLCSSVSGGPSLGVLVSFLNISSWKDANGASEFTQPPAILLFVMNVDDVSDLDAQLVAHIGHVVVDGGASAQSRGQAVMNVDLVHLQTKTVRWTTPIDKVQCHHRPRSLCLACH